MIDIVNLTKMEALRNVFTEQLKSDKKYDATLEKLVVLFDNIQPIIDEKTSEQLTKQRIYLNVNAQIHKKLADVLQQFTHDLTTHNETFKTEMERLNKEKNERLQTLGKDQRQLYQIYEQQQQNVDEEYQSQLDKYEVELKREIATHEKQANLARKNYQKQSEDVEKEIKAVLGHLETAKTRTFEKAKKEKEALQTNFTEKQNTVQQNSQTTKEENDKIYLNIRNTYHRSTTEFNAAVNQLNKEFQTAKKKLTTDYENKTAPVLEKLAVLNKNYEETKQMVLKQHQHLLTQLDERFVQEQNAYQEKKDRLIHQANDDITILNSKLSAFRESITNEKLEKTRHYRMLIQEAETERAKDLTQRELARIFRGLDDELNKQIIRTQKDINRKQKENHRIAHIHDIHHLKEMNDWRLERRLAEYKFKQEIAKTDLNYNHNLHISKKHLELLEDIHDYQLKMLETTLKLNLLPLETQLGIQSLIQERELNLLNNDQHMAAYFSRYENAKIQNEYDLNLEEQNWLEQKANLTYHSEVQVTQLTSQLELEKIKSRRDFSANEAQIRSAIAQSIFEKQKHQNDEQHQILSEEIIHKKALYQIDERYKVEKIKIDQQHTSQLLELNLLEKKALHHLKTSRAKNKKQMQVYLNELALRHHTSEQLFGFIYAFYNKQIQLKTIIKDLYRLPAHPEDFQFVLEHLLDFETTLKVIMIEMIQTYKASDHQFYEKKIDEKTSYKYMLKHENILNFYTQEIEKVEKQKASMTQDIRLDEQQLLSFQQTIESHIQQIEKTKQQIALSQQNRTKTAQDQRLVKQHQQQITTLEKEIKDLKIKSQRLSKLINRKLQNLLPFDKKMEQYQISIKKQEALLDRKQHKEAQEYHLYQKRNQLLYKALENDIITCIEFHERFLKELTKTTYITDSVLYNEEKKLVKNQRLFENKLVVHQQSFLKQMLRFYQINDHKQQVIYNDFSRANHRLLRGIKKQRKVARHHQELAINRYLRDKDHDLKLQYQKYKFRLRALQTKMKKAEQLLVNKIKSLENKLEAHITFTSLELKSINDNQKQIAVQYQDDYQRQLNLIEGQHKKQLEKLSEALEQENNNYQNFVQSTESKNQVLLQKFDQDRQKLLESNQTKQRQYQTQTDRIRQNIEKQQKAFDDTVRTLQVNRSYEIKNMHKHTEKYEMSEQKGQQKVFKRELRGLKKTYFFKLRSLRLK
ncbi:MAG: hypothetical protein WC225_03660 [Acholeplasmataceae bacterium]|nr:hypothetical protein [Acholeplasmataceae bacterium]